MGLLNFVAKKALNNQELLPNRAPTIKVVFMLKLFSFRGF